MFVVHHFLLCFHFFVIELPSRVFFVISFRTPASKLSDLESLLDFTLNSDNNDIFSKMKFKIPL